MVSHFVIIDIIDMFVIDVALKIVLTTDLSIKLFWKELNEHKFQKVHFIFHPSVR